jgi:peptidoglycan/LPS O-acetylase OafA/YrhL/lysophospholipase L1-like esterase
LEQIKGIAIAWIILNHLSERIFGYPYIGNPNADWPRLAERWEQLRPLSGSGVWDLPINLLRYAGWSGDQGVQLFLIATGFGLTWSLLQRGTGARFALREFYAARAVRIFPLWWLAHAAVAVGLFALAREERLAIPAFLLSALGIRATPELLYFLVPAWWYVGCLLQIYLIYPLLWWSLRRHGTGSLWLIAGAAVVIRAVGLLSMHDWLDAWSRGAVCITRLPEVVFGMWLAARLRSRGEMASPAGWRVAIALCLSLYVAGTLLSLTLPGMSVAPLLLGGSSFVLLAAILNKVPARFPCARSSSWLGAHSYALYLVHQPLLHLFLPQDAAQLAPLRVVAGSTLGIASTLVAATSLEQLAALLPRTWRYLRQHRRPRRAATAMLMVAASSIWAAEALIERFDPQEVFGWGERPALEPDPIAGWKLKPNSRTHLRWQCYDYTVSANALGFPGPQYPEQKPVGALRVLTTGDAFTSAEGVDTPAAWPRLLEASLRARLGRPVEVLNFAITGYGPNQYAAVVRTFAPRFHPDLILLAMFVNDLDDVLETTAAFQASIGFGRPDPNGWVAFLSAAHLRRRAQLWAVEWASERWRGQPGPHGYFLAQLAALERRPESAEAKARQQLRGRLREIEAVSREIGAQVAVLLIPAPVQVCEAEELAYYPSGIDLSDARQFDMQRPQRLLSELARQHSMAVVDLLPALRSAVPCPYFSCNLHWTAAGHRTVAAALVEYVAAEQAAH